MPEHAVGTREDWQAARDALAVWVAGTYLVGVAVLKRRGDRWPVGRTVSFVVLGMGKLGGRELLRPTGAQHRSLTRSRRGISRR